MKLHRIALQEFRKFREPVALDNLDPGLNVIAGPNEAGKSTYALALRAAFLERYGTSKVADLAPYGLSGARPSVTVAFEHAGHQYVLSKQFLHRARCELLVDDQRLEGDEAEQALARLLGFEIPGRGQSKPEHAGVPGLLWIAQGSGQDLAEPALHAAGQVREALTHITGELASQDGDRFHAQVQEARAALLDARGGKPKGAYKAAEEAYLRLGEAREALLRERAELDADVDRLAVWRQEYEHNERTAPWLALEQQAGQARDRLQALAREEEALERLRRDAAEAQRLAQALREQLARDQQDAETLAQLRADATAAAQAAEQAGEGAARSAHGREQAEAALQQARTTFEALQEARRQTEMREALRRLINEQARLDAALAAAQAATGQAERLQKQWQAARIDAGAMAALRKSAQECEALRLRQELAATRIRHALQPGVVLELGGQRLQGQGEVFLSEATELALPGVGTLSIQPGGRDLPTLQRELAEAQTRLAKGLQSLGLETLAQGEARLALAEQLERELAQARGALAAQAPQGVQALIAESAEAAAARDRLQAQVLPDTGEQDLQPRLAAAADAVQRGQAAVQAAVAQARQAETALIQAQGRASLLREQADIRQAAFEAEAQAARRAARAAQFAQAEQRQQDCRRQVAQAEAALAEHRPEQVRQDAERFARSAELARQAQQERHARLLQLQGKLEQAGAQGLGERLAATEAEWQRAGRLRDDYARRAAALDLLWRLLDEQRETATRRLLQPLSERLSHYLGLVFPGAQLRLDEHLLPAALTRTGQEDALAALSFGTREQLGLLARLAYADLLQQAGRPTLLVLDDALVHADDRRREQVKRALFDAALRHQILLFTCHAEAWQDMGVPVRQLDAFTR
ncbi:AAA family ATPase [Bordetella genomosp. 12]|uniref:GTP-binding protein n=1 Tax=Bordetella genomosp. 12 TaxID=463035 RepID=A0A261VLT4_9BORD|nr:AAA family ATPase [Bordetella genomosp. 12]OZI75019.1 GTP-binding protein [Bordetella genomosp. 12]